MKTALFSLSYLDGDDKSGSSRIERNVKYLEYYWPLREELGFDSIILADNASTVRNIAILADLAPAPVSIHSVSEDFKMLPLFASGTDQDPIRILRFENHLAYGSTFPKEDPRSHFDYPYCWRGLEVVRLLFTQMGYDKVIAIDSDGFVLRAELAWHIRNVNHGWWTLWCPKYQFPETSLQVIMREPFLTRYCPADWKENVGQIMEHTLPFTEVLTRFVADRYGETRRPVLPEMHFYGQAPVDIKMKYRGCST